MGGLLLPLALGFRDFVRRRADQLEGFQIAVGWFLLSVVSLGATAGLTTGHVAKAVGYLLGFVILAVLLGRPLVRGAMRLADRSEAPGSSIVTAVVIVLAGAAVTQALGMEPIFGAFVAGHHAERGRTPSQDRP